MKLGAWNGVVLVAAIAGVTLIGCGRSPLSHDGAGEKKPTRAGETKGHEHDDWWCAEHGVPEEECSQCNAKVAVDFKAKGDWCPEHDRAKSQCFVCDPKLKEKYAALYRAKEGKEPPPLEQEMQEKKEETPKKESKR